MLAHRARCPGLIPACCSGSTARWRAGRTVGALQCAAAAAAPRPRPCTGQAPGRSCPLLFTCLSFQFWIQARASAALSPAACAHDARRRHTRTPSQLLSQYWFFYGAWLARFGVPQHAAMRCIHYCMPPVKGGEGCCGLVGHQCWWALPAGVAWVPPAQAPVAEASHHNSPCARDQEIPAHSAIAQNIWLISTPSGLSAVVALLAPRPLGEHTPPPATP